MKNTAIKLKNVKEVYKSYSCRSDTLKEKLLRGVFIGKGRVEKITALNGISLSVKKGEIIGIIGENGSGKTTLLKVIAGILKPDSGNVEVNGKVSSLFQLGIGFQRELSGRENIYLNGAVLGLSRVEIDKKLDSIIAFSELEDFIDMPLRTYSSGMEMRLGFSIAVNLDPDIVLIDEVLIIGDEAFQKKCLDYLDTFRNKNKTVVIVSHSMSIIKRLCDRVILLRKGKIIFDGGAAEGVSYYYKISGRREGIAAVKKGKLEVIFNNGVIYIFNGKKLITASSGIIFEIGERKSFSFKWTADAGNEVLVCKAERVALKISFLGENIFFDIDSSPEKSVFYISVPDESALWFAGWRIGAWGESNGIIYSGKDENAVFGVFPGSRSCGLLFEGEKLAYEFSVSEAGEKITGFSGFSPRFSVSLIDNERMIYDRIEALKKENMLLSGPAAIVFDCEEKQVSLFLHGEEVTCGEGVYVSFFDHFRWFVGKDFFWKFKKTSDAEGILFFGEDVSWKFYLKGGKIFSEISFSGNYSEVRFGFRFKELFVRKGFFPVNLEEKKNIIPYDEIPYFLSFKGGKFCPLIFSPCDAVHVESGGSGVLIAADGKEVGVSAETALFYFDGISEGAALENYGFFFFFEVLKELYSYSFFAEDKLFFYDNSKNILRVFSSAFELSGKKGVGFTVYCRENTAESLASKRVSVVKNEADFLIRHFFSFGDFETEVLMGIDREGRIRFEFEEGVFVEPFVSFSARLKYCRYNLDLYEIGGMKNIFLTYPDLFSFFDESGTGVLIKGAGFSPFLADDGEEFFTILKHTDSYSLKLTDSGMLEVESAELAAARVLESFPLRLFVGDNAFTLTVNGKDISSSGWLDYEFISDVKYSREKILKKIDRVSENRVAVALFASCGKPLCRFYITFSENEISFDLEDIFSDKALLKLTFSFSSVFDRWIFNSAFGKIGSSGDWTELPFPDESDIEFLGLKGCNNSFFAAAENSGILEASVFLKPDGSRNLHIISSRSPELRVKFFFNVPQFDLLPFYLLLVKVMEFFDSGIERGGIRLIPFSGGLHISCGNIFVTGGRGIVFAKKGEKGLFYPEQVFVKHREGDFSVRYLFGDGSFFDVSMRFDECVVCFMAKSCGEFILGLESHFDKFLASGGVKDDSIDLSRKYTGAVKFVSLLNFDSGISVNVFAEKETSFESSVKKSFFEDSFTELSIMVVPGHAISLRIADLDYPETVNRKFLANYTIGNENIKLFYSNNSYKLFWKGKLVSSSFGMYGSFIKDGILYESIKAENKVKKVFEDEFEVCVNYANANMSEKWTVKIEDTGVYVKRHFEPFQNGLLKRQFFFLVSDDFCEWVCAGNRGGVTQHFNPGAWEDIFLPLKRAEDIFLLSSDLELPVVAAEPSDEKSTVTLHSGWNGEHFAVIAHTAGTGEMDCARLFLISRELYRVMSDFLFLCGGLEAVFAGFFYIILFFLRLLLLLSFLFMKWYGVILSLFRLGWGSNNFVVSSCEKIMYFFAVSGDEVFPMKFNDFVYDGYKWIGGTEYCLDYVLKHKDKSRFSYRLGLPDLDITRNIEFSIVGEKVRVSIWYDSSREIVKFRHIFSIPEKFNEWFADANSGEIPPVSPGIIWDYVLPGSKAKSFIGFSFDGGAGEIIDNYSLFAEERRFHSVGFEKKAELTFVAGVKNGISFDFFVGSGKFWHKAITFAKKSFCDSLKEENAMKIIELSGLKAKAGENGMVLFWRNGVFFDYGKMLPWRVFVRGGNLFLDGGKISRLSGKDGYFDFFIEGERAFFQKWKVVKDIDKIVINSEIFLKTGNVETDNIEFVIPLPDDMRFWRINYMKGKFEQGGGRKSLVTFLGEMGETVAAFSKNGVDWITLSEFKSDGFDFDLVQIDEKKYLSFHIDGKKRFFGGYGVNMAFSVFSADESELERYVYKVREKYLLEKGLFLFHISRFGIELFYDGEQLNGNEMLNFILRYNGTEKSSFFAARKWEKITYNKGICNFLFEDLTVAMEIIVYDTFVKFFFSFCAGEATVEAFSFLGNLRCGKILYGNFARDIKKIGNKTFFYSPVLYWETVKGVFSIGMGNNIFGHYIYEEEGGEREKFIRLKLDNINNKLKIPVIIGKKTESCELSVENTTLRMFPCYSANHISTKSGIITDFMGVYASYFIGGGWYDNINDAIRELRGNRIYSYWKNFAIKHIWETVSENGQLIIKIRCNISAGVDFDTEHIGIILQSCYGGVEIMNNRYTFDTLCPVGKEEVCSFPGNVILNGAEVKFFSEKECDTISFLINSVKPYKISILNWKLDKIYRLLLLERIVDGTESEVTVSISRGNNL